MNQFSRIHALEKLSIGFLPALLISAVAVSASPGLASPTPVRAIFTGRLDAGQDPYPLGLSNTDTFTWAIVFNPAFPTLPGVLGSQFTWQQLAASPTPLYSPATLTSPFNTGISGATYNSPGTAPTDIDSFVFNTSLDTFFLGTGRPENNSGLSVTFAGAPPTLSPVINWTAQGALPGFNAAGASDLYTFLTQSIGPSGLYSCNSLNNPGCGGTGLIETGENPYSFTWTSVRFEVPGPLGVAGLAPFLGYSRKLRRRLQTGKQSPMPDQFNSRQTQTKD